MRNLLKTSVTVFLLMILSGCLEKQKETDKNKEKDVSSEPSESRNDTSQPASETKKDILVSSARLESDTIIILGSNLVNVTNLSVKKDSAEFILSIESKSKDRITAKAKSGLVLAAGIIFCKKASS